MPEQAGSWTDLDEVEFGLIVEGPGEHATAKATISEGYFTLTTSDDAEPIERALADAALQLAMLVALGPRERPTAASAILIADEIAGVDRASLLSTWDPETLAASPLGADDVVVWTAWTTWPDPADAAALLIRELVVADGGEGGIAIIELDDEGGVTVRPCSSTDVWIKLTALLPRPFEVREPMAVGQDA